MEKQNLSDGLSKSRFSRRRFLGGAATTVAGLTIVPRHVFGGAGYVPPSDKINIAFIGVGSQGLRVMLGFLRQPDVQAVAVCDPNRGSGDYPQWDKSEFCNRVRKLLNVTSGWEWLSPDQPIRLTHSMEVTGGMAGREPCQKIVEAYYGVQKRSGEYRGCTAYSDFRELLEKEKDVDAVVVGTTDNLHAAVSVAAMRKGKHVFCQKPMTHTVYEARRVAEIARETGVATQVAVGNQASEDTRLYANGFGTVPLGRCAKSSTGRAVPSGLKASTDPKKQSRCPKAWIGTYGSARRRSAPSTTPTCPLSGAAGTPSVTAPSATWAATVSTPFSVC